MTKTDINVVVAGGGAAGLTAAIAAARKGARVTVLEKNPRVGKKILATGNGRCNYTNTNLEITHFHGANPKFAYRALSRFDQWKTIDFFERLGVAHRVEAQGKVYPVSNQASSVLDVLRYELDRLGVEVVCEAPVKEIIRGGKHSQRGYKVITEDGREFKCHRVVIATGGKAAPNLGANGSGYDLAVSLGHSIVTPFPALVQLKLEAGFLKHVKGIKFEGDAELVVENRVKAGATGEILFTEYGISGPPIFDLSRKAGELMQAKQNVWLKLVLINFMSPEELEGFLVKRFGHQPGKPLAFNFVGFLNKRLAPVVLREAGIDDINKPAGEVTAEERKRIMDLLLDWRLKIKGTTSWPAAQVTAGGVDVSEINGQTMESRLSPGIFFAGEVVDIDGDCGGYNLQWAWSSGFTAGESAAVR